MKDYLNRNKQFSDGSFIVADRAYNGEKNSHLASEHNLRLVTTNFTGRKPHANVKTVHTKNAVIHDFWKHGYEKSYPGNLLEEQNNCNTWKQKISLSMQGLEMELRQFPLFFVEDIMWTRYLWTEKNALDYSSDLK